MAKWQPIHRFVSHENLNALCILKIDTYKSQIISTTNHQLKQALGEWHTKYSNNFRQQKMHDNAYGWF